MKTEREIQERIDLHTAHMIHAEKQIDLAREAGNIDSERLWISNRGSFVTAITNLKWTMES